MKSSPSILRQNYMRTSLISDNTPKRPRKGSTSKNNKSPNSNSSMNWSSRKDSSKKANTRNDIAIYDNFHKELLDLQTACINHSPEFQGLSNNNRFNDSGDFISRRNMIKCKYHDEDFNFFSVDDKKFLCNKCLYSKYEKLLPGTSKSSVLPIEKCGEYLAHENTHFVEIECQQYIRQLQRSISICNFNSNFLVQKQETFQGVISTEFDNLYQQLRKQEESLMSSVNTFFDQTIKENIAHLQNLKFLLDNIQRVREFGKHNNLEQNIFQYSFANKLRKALEETNFNASKLVSNEFDIIGNVHKDKIKKEIERLGKPLPKCLETLITESKSFQSLRSSSESVSPIKYSRRSLKEGSLFDITHKKSSSIDKKDHSSSSKHQRKPSSEYIRIKELEALLSSDMGQPAQMQTQFFDDSNILTDSKLQEEALELFPLSISRTRKIYSLSRDGASSQVFHRKCNGQGPYIVLAKTEGKNIFGYYCPLQFISNDKYCGSEQFWIFSLKSQVGRGMVFKIKPEKNFIALFNSSKSPCLGSTIKGKEDLFIDFDNLSASCSNVGYAYKIWDSKLDGSKVLGGKPSGWNFDEIEVYHIEE